MKKRYVILKIILLTICVISVLYNISFATGIVRNFDGSGASFGGADTKIRSTLAIALLFVRNVGAGLAALILMVLGCKYIIASAGERAEIKKNAIVYVIGAVVLFSASAILNIIINFVTSATSP